MRIMEFHNPPTKTFDDSPYPYSTPKFRLIFVKKIRYMVSICYIESFGCQKKLSGKNHRGVQQPPFRGRGLMIIPG